MAMGTRRRCLKQASMRVATHDLPPRSTAHPFYTRQNHILDKADFDAHGETQLERVEPSTESAARCARRPSPVLNEELEWDLTQCGGLFYNTWSEVEAVAGAVRPRVVQQSGARKRSQCSSISM